MKQRYFCVFVVLFIAVLCQAAASERTYNVLFIQSYTSQTPWHRDLNQGLVKGFKDNGLKVNITTEYLDADFWAFRSEKVIMRRFCERARDRETDLIVTSSDEAFYTLFACGDSLPLQIPVVFFGIKYPDEKLFAAHPNVCGYTVNPDFDIILREAQRLFPKRKEVICVIDNSFLSNKGLEDFQEEWEVFQKDNPDYDMKIYNTQNQTTSHIISAICYPRNSYGRVVIAPKWSPFLSFVGKNSKAPVFATQNVGLTNGVFGAYDCDAYTSAMQAAQRASSVLKGTSPKDVGVTEIPQGFIYDYKQLEFFHVNPDKIGSKGTVVNEPYWEKYKLLFILLYPSILALLIASIVWLMRVNRREAKRRVQAQTRLLVQNKMVEQRNEFENVFHSIRDGVITYDTDLHIHFTNRSLLQMLHLPFDIGGRVYEGMMAGSIFKIYHNGQDILHKMLKEVAKTGKSVMIPQGAFMKEVQEKDLTVDGAMTDPKGILYNPVRRIGEAWVVSNGDQTDAIRDCFAVGRPWEEALRASTFKQDAPDFTPRISAIVNPDGSFEMSILKHADGDRCTREFFAYEGVDEGCGYFISTYQGDGNPLPTFAGEPIPVTLPTPDALWAALNDDNKVSLYANVGGEVTLYNKNLGD